MTIAPANGHDLFDALDTLARLVGGPVALEDLNFRVLAYSAVSGQRDDEARRAAILGRRTPDRWLRWMNKSGLRDTLRQADWPVQLDIPWATEMSRYIQPVRRGGRVVGYLWIMCDAVPLGDDLVQVIRDFADLVAVEVADRVPGGGDDPHARALTQFLAGTVPAALLAQLMKVDEHATELVVIAVEAHTGTPSAAPHAMTLRAEVWRALSLYARLQLPHALATGGGGQRAYLLMCATTLDSAIVGTTLERIADLVSRALGGTVVFACAGRVHTGLVNTAASRSEADAALLALTAMDKGSTSATYDQMQLAIVLNHAVDAVRDCGPVVTHVRDRLRAADDERTEEQIRTLACYLDCFGDVRDASTRLNIHPNTLRYRLRRVEQTAGISLSDPDTRVALDLVLRSTATH